jgi:hypothetical protein
MKILTLEQMNAVSGGAGTCKKPKKHSANHSASAASNASHAASSMAHASSTETSPE